MVFSFLYLFHTVITARQRGGDGAAISYGFSYVLPMSDTLRWIAGERLQLDGGASTSTHPFVFVSSFLHSTYIDSSIKAVKKLM